MSEACGVVLPIGRLLAATALIATAVLASGAGQQAAGAADSQPPAAGRTAASARPSVVAWVDASPIYYRDVERAIAAFSKGKRIEAEKLPRVQASALQDLIDQKNLSNFLKGSELQATSAEVDAAVADFTKKLQRQKQDLNDYLVQNKMTETALRNQLKQEVALQKYISKNATDDALQQYFHDNKPLFDGTERHVSHIILRPLGAIDEAALNALLFQARQLRGRIAVGEISFESAARRYSDGPSRYNGGDLGYIPRQGVASQSFSDAAFALNSDEISQPVLDAMGVHLIRATDSKPGQKKWRDVREALKGAYTRVLLAKLMEDLRGKAKIEFFEGFPHFIPGTHELSAPQPVGIAQ